MNHLETYSMSKVTNVGGTIEILRLATHHRLKTVNYLSTLSVFNTNAGNSRALSERSSIDDERHSLFDGYSASKWVGEKLASMAGEQGVPCNVFRLGLVWSDTGQGRYDELQREYRVLKTCLLSGIGIDRYRYLMPPTPVDYVAQAVVHLATRHRDGGKTFHITSAAQEIHDVFRRCNEIAGTSLKLVPYGKWISEVRRLHLHGKSLPAVPLIQGMFSMGGEEAMALEWSGSLSDGLRIECQETHRELERAGVVAPVLNDELLLRCVEGMYMFDDDLRRDKASSIVY
jgi:thioester reductase-like protein